MKREIEEVHLEGIRRIDPGESIKEQVKKALPLSRNSKGNIVRRSNERKFVFDAWAILAWLQDEESAQTLLQLRLLYSRWQM